MTANHLVQHFSVGDRIGEYKVERRIRSGGMATLFLARRSGVFGFSRVAAIKVIHPHLSQDERLVRMFIDEARILSRISHPNVVHVEEFRESQGLLYLVMEYVAGCSAAQLMSMLREQKEKLPVALAVHIAMKTAEGLHSAHETTDDEGRPLGIVHRDVSPPNILVSTEGNVKLIDFGIAKAYGLRQDTWTGHSLKGKVRYMCPEQARGESIDRRADIYSLGLVLWELLTEEPAFQAETELALLDIVRAPQLGSLHNFRRDVPAALVEAIETMTAVDPKDRPPDAYAAARMLAAAIPVALLVEPRHIGEYVRRCNAWAARPHGKGGRAAVRLASTTPHSPTGKGPSEPARATSGELAPVMGEEQRAPGASAEFTSRSATDSKTGRRPPPRAPFHREGAFDPPPPGPPPTLGRMMWWHRALAWAASHPGFSIAGGLVLVGVIVGLVAARASVAERSLELPSTGARAVEAPSPAVDDGKSGAASAGAPPGAMRPTADGALADDGSGTAAVGSAPSVAPVDAERTAAPAEDPRASGPTWVADGDRAEGVDRFRGASPDRSADGSSGSTSRTRRSSHRDRRKTESARKEAANASDSRPSESRSSDSGSAQESADDGILHIDGISLAKDPDAPASPDRDDRDRRRRKTPARAGKTPIADGFEEK